MSTPTDPISLRSDRAVASHLVLWCAASAMVFSGLLASFLLVRGVGGGFESLPAGPALILGAVGCAATLAFRMLGFPVEATGPTRWLYALPTPMLLLLGLALTVPGIAWWAGLTLWLLVVLEEGWAWGSLLLGGPTSLLDPRNRSSEHVRLHAPHDERGEGHSAQTRRAERADPAENGSTHTAIADRNHSADPEDLEDSEEGLLEEESRLPDEVLLQLTRVRDADGESLVAQLRAEFSPRQRTATLHLPFCPPWSVRPELEVHQVDGPPASLKVTLLEVYGSRIDVRLRQPTTTDTSVVLECFVRSCDPA